MKGKGRVKEKKMGSERVNLAVNWSEKCRGRRGRKNGGWWRARTGGS